MGCILFLTAVLGAAVNGVCATDVQPWSVSRATPDRVE